MNENHKHNGESTNIRPEQLTAHALGQLEGHELASVEHRLAEPNQAQARQAVAETRRLAECLKTTRDTGDTATSPQLRAAVLAQLEKQPDPPPVEVARRPNWQRRLAWLAIGSAAAVLAAIALIPPIKSARESARRAQASSSLRQLDAIQSNFQSFEGDRMEVPADPQSDGLVTLPDATNPIDYGSRTDLATTSPATQDEALIGPLAAYPLNEGQADPKAPTDAAISTALSGSEKKPLIATYGGTNRTSPQPANDYYFQGQGQAGGLASGYGGYGNASQGNAQGAAGMKGGGGYGSSGYSGSGGMMAGGQPRAGQTIVAGDFYDARVGADPADKTHRPELEKLNEHLQGLHDEGWYYNNREQYEQIVENSFLAPTDHPLSTFSIDVDTASYSNVRRFLTGGRLPPPAAVRIEELVNYFSYSYPQPKGTEPFSVNMETAECPWQPGHVLLRVGLKGKEIHRAERPPSNLVFLLDVSGSMADENKLPLLKTSLLMFVAELTENDRVSIVTYAGEAGLRLPPTSGDQKAKIMQAIESLSAGGSTNGSAGIELAYEQAGQYFLKEGANRVILATDGDLNVGVTSDEALVELIKSKAAAGTFLTVLGFGEGNLQDAKLEKLADNGNGMYAYIDSVREGRKVLVEQMSGSTVTIAKDVKIQIEFNPAQIASYRLLGYENRVLAAKDFNDDKKDAGEIGAGHTGTALYDLVLVGTKQAAAEVPPVAEPLKYQSNRISQIVVGDVPKASSRELTEAASTGELLTLKLRYKAPDGIESRLIEFPLKDRGGKFNAASKDLQFAAAVASFGMVLRGSEHKGTGSLAAVSEIAGGAIGDDPSGYRAEFVDLVRRAQALGAK